MAHESVSFGNWQENPWHRGMFGHFPSDPVDHAAYIQVFGTLHPERDDFARAVYALTATGPEMYEYVVHMAGHQCCKTPGCNTENPMCHTLRARSLLLKFDDARVRWER